MSSSRMAGYLFGLVAYVWWGLVPLYFRAIQGVPALEILAHRIVWSIALMLGLTLIFREWTSLRRAILSRRIVGSMMLSGMLLAINWYLYIFATETNRVTEASLGYYMMPLANAFLATLFLGEKLRPAHWPALAIIVLGVAIPFVARQDFTWLAVALPLTFGCYGLVRKVAAVDSFTGLTLETLILGIPSISYLIWKSRNGLGHFGENLNISLLLAAGGIITVVPLLTYILSLKRLPLLAVNLIQFISPTMQVLVGVYLLHETISWDRWAAMICVWIAVAIFIADAILAQHHRRRTQAEELTKMATMAEV